MVHHSVHQRELLLKKVVKEKYLKNKIIGEVQWKPGDSHFWLGFTKVKDQFLEFSTFNLHNGTQVRFWEDKCLEISLSKISIR
jgi:hypothetical protein